jgi:hypothetical protein
MKRTRFHMLALSAVAAMALSQATPVSANRPDNGGVTASPSFAEFKAATFRDTDGQYIVNGDEAIPNKAKLRKYYNRMVSKVNKNDSQSLIVNTVSGADDLWSGGQQGNLTYCVSDSFGADKSTIVAAMDSGAALWEGASSAVDFTYVPSADASCSVVNNSVVFSVEPTTTNQYIARAFFPSTSDFRRNVLVNTQKLLSYSKPASDVLSHELGHTLGFRHEHTRPEAGTCFENNNWRPLTPYDSNSIMHYPQCNGGEGALSFSDNDAAGVRAVYGG